MEILTRTPSTAKSVHKTTTPAAGPSTTALTLSRLLTRLTNKLSHLEVPNRYELRKLLLNLNHARILQHQLEYELTASKPGHESPKSAFAMTTNAAKNIITGNRKVVDVEKMARLMEDCVRWKGDIGEIEGRILEMERRRREDSGDDSEFEASDEEEEDEVHQGDTKKVPEVVVSETVAEKDEKAAPMVLSPASETGPSSPVRIAPRSLPFAMTSTGILPMPSPALSTFSMSSSTLHSPNIRHRFHPQPKTPPTTSISTEVVLDHVRQEQDTITKDLLIMAKQLKESSISFGKELENEKPLLDAATEGLGKNISGMETTGGKLRALKKDQRVGFVKRMIFLAVGLVLMLAILFVMTLPKIR